MALWLLIPAAVFAYLAYDTWRLRASSRSLPYAIEAEARGEPVAHVPLKEQSRRRAWGQLYGLGEPSGVFWVWAILGLGCLAGAVVGAFA